ncbi:MAG: methyltransferase domain-containing protein [Candidatus Eisenbacteria bacterium]
MTDLRRIIAWYYLLAALMVGALGLVAATPALTGDQDHAGEGRYADFGEVRAGFLKAYEAGDYARALEIADRINEIVESGHIEALYDMACLYSLQGENEKAYFALERAVGAGFHDAKHLLKDTDLESVCKEAWFKSIVDEAQFKDDLISMAREDERDFQTPGDILDVLDLKPGERVADIGSGSGFFTIPAARTVGPSGVVWAIDISRDMLDYVARRADVCNLENVRTKKVPDDDPQLPAEGIDTILMIDTWHYIQDPKYAIKIRAGLADGGRVVIIDYTPKPRAERPWGPSPEDLCSRESVDADMAAAGLVPIKAVSLLPEQYFVIYEAR